MGQGHAGGKNRLPDLKIVEHDHRDECQAGRLGGSRCRRNWSTRWSPLLAQRAHQKGWVSVVIPCARGRRHTRSIVFSYRRWFLHARTFGLIQAALDGKDELAWKEHCEVARWGAGLCGFERKWPGS